MGDGWAYSLKKPLEQQLHHQTMEGVCRVIGMTRRETARDGNCFFMSVLQGHQKRGDHRPHAEILPNKEGNKWLREQCCNLLESEESINGTPMQSIRAHNGLTEKGEDLKSRIKPWRNAGVWLTDGGTTSLLMQFMATVILGCPIIMVSDELFLGRMRMYGLQHEGQLVKDKDSEGKDVIQAYHQKGLWEALTQLDAIWTYHEGVHYNQLERTFAPALQDKILPNKTPPSPRGSRPVI